MHALDDDHARDLRDDELVIDPAQPDWLEMISAIDRLVAAIPSQKAMLLKQIENGALES